MESHAKIRKRYHESNYFEKFTIERVTWEWEDANPERGGGYSRKGRENEVKFETAYEITLELVTHEFPFLVFLFPSR